MKKTNIFKRVIALGLALGLMVSVGAEARAEYIDRAHKIKIYFGTYVDIIPDKVINGKTSSGLAGVRYEKPMMAASTYTSKEPFTVAKLASVWARILELDPNPGAPVPKDVKKGKWYYNAFERLSKTHILDYLVDKDGNIHPDRQLYIYEIHRSIKYYWDYSGFTDIKDEATGFIRQKYDQAGVDTFKKRTADFHERYKGRIWYNDVAQVVDVGWSHGLHSMFSYTEATKKATNKDAMFVFFNFTGRTIWPGSPGFNKNIKIKPGHKLWTDFEQAALQSRPHGFIN